MPHSRAPSEAAGSQNGDTADGSTIEVDFRPISSATSDADGPAFPEDQASPHSGSASVSNLDGASDNGTSSAGPRRGSFTSDIPHGHSMPTLLVDTPPLDGRPVDDGTPPISKADLQTTLNASLAPKSGILASQPLPLVGQQDELLTDSDHEVRSSVPLTQPTPRSVDASNDPQSYMPPPPPQGYYSTYKLDATPQMPPPKREPKTSARRVKEYTLSDGSVVSGKGLGRGRPGVKRGPRKPKYSILDADGLPVRTTTPAGASTGVPSFSRKRKRTDSDVSMDRLSSFASRSVSSESRESSVEYNPIEETRSGRKVQKNSAAPPTAAEIASPASKRPKFESTISASISPSVVKNHPKIKRRIYRGREQLALCEHCLRGHGPPGNVIVFCDACNKCWHQRCHDPQVPQSVIANAKAEWYCSDCDRILYGNKGKKSALAKLSSIVSNEPPPPAFSGPLIGGSTLTHPQKQTYLHTLTKEKLISLILSASELAPALPLFQAPAPQLPQPKFTSNYVTPVSTPHLPPAEDDEGYDSHFDEHAYLYPKPGEGVKLPPESADLHMLLESKESRTFSHWVRGVVGREFSGTGDIKASHAHS